MEKKYTFIEVLICLREEYIKNELELKRLKRYTEMRENNKIKSYDFRCICGSCDEYLALSRKMIEARQKLLSIIYGKTEFMLPLILCKKVSNGDYVIEKDIYEDIKINNQEAFNEQADKILNSDFNLNATNVFVDVVNGYVDFTCDSVYMSDDEKRQQSSYMSREDILRVFSQSRLNKSGILELLNKPISATTLNDWQREIIDKNYNQIGDIIIPKLIKPCHKLNLAIEKKDKKVYLKKI